MPMTLHSLGIDRLSVADRLALLEEIWDSIAADPDHVPVTAAQQEDLQRRLAALDANPAGSTWEEVKTRLMGRP